MMKMLRFYQTREGKAPFIDWLETVKHPVAQGHINTRVRRLALGRRADCKRVGKGVFELRIHSGPGYRVYTRSTLKFNSEQASFYLA